MHSIHIEGFSGILLMISWLVNTSVETTDTEGLEHQHL